MRRFTPNTEYSIDYIVTRVASSFDDSFYGTEYPDVTIPEGERIWHFCETGWLEGRNPSPFFDTVSYITTHVDVSSINMNPLFHYVVQGRREGREVSPSISPSVRSRLLFGETVVDWVSLIRPHVDASYYSGQLPSGLEEIIDLAAHFAFTGWRVGLSPSREMRLSELRRLYPAACAAMVNPLIAHIRNGMPATKDNLPQQTMDAVSRNAEASPEQGEGAPGSSDPLVPIPLPDDIRASFDEEFYLESNPDVAKANVDPLEHYFYTGWREGRAPSPDFDVEYYLSQNPDVAALNLEPYWHYIMIGRAEQRQTRASRRSHRTDLVEEIEVVRREFSVTFYLSTNPDVASSGVDPVEHYVYAGWREGRNPSEQFDTRYYLRANDDVRLAGINPFWHYLVAGRNEGRLPVQPGGFRREIIETALPPSERVRDWPAAEGNILGPGELQKELKLVLRAGSSVAVALSHDCYTKIVGGTQIFIADEQAAFAKKGTKYLHISPQQPRLSLAPESRTALFQVVLDGVFLGLTLLKELCSGIASIKRDGRSDVFFIVHSVLGFNELDIHSLYESAEPTRSVFWVHDYSSICEGFNLLRNDLEYCGAPPSGSLSCRVCCYGEYRMTHRARLRWLFDRCSFDVVAPSRIALEIWERASGLPRRSAKVHSHWRLLGRRSRRRVTGEVDLGKRRAVRVAFVGFPAAQKGWPIFNSLVNAFHGDDRYRFVHFGAAGARRTARCEFVQTEVSAAKRFRTVEVLSEENIDFLLVLSTWPETFSYVAHEGLAAGCYLLCLRESGNVAAVANEKGAGYVFEGVAELLEFFKGQEATSVAAAWRQKSKGYSIQQCGTTATISWDVA